MMLLALLLAFSALLPAAPWPSVSPAKVGWSQAKLDEARRSSGAGGPGAVFATVDGKALVAWGDVDQPRNVRSIRKSVVSALIGQEIARGKLSLQATLADLGITERTPLTEMEGKATIADLLTSRSGVFLPAAYELPSNSASRPARGTYSPGTVFHYGNWGFNVLGVIFEKTSGEDLYQAFETRLATPLGMQDFRRPRDTRLRKEDVSLHPAHLFRLSPRDLARFVHLYLNEGRWGTHQVLPASWVAESTRPHVQVPRNPNGAHYGYLWWIYPQSERNPSLAFAVQGAGGAIGVAIPKLRLVFVFTQEAPDDRTNLAKLEAGRGWQLLQRITTAAPPRF
ncbi:MAG: serine hydrolase [Bryobacteraceae bacterium]|nr:serine hydrolase [Bryobacteraceae bacterium]